MDSHNTWRRMFRYTPRISLSLSSLHRNVHLDTLDSFWTTSRASVPPGALFRAMLFSTSVNAAVCTADLIMAWDESGFYKKHSGH